MQLADGVVKNSLFPCRMQQASRHGKWPNGLVIQWLKLEWRTASTEPYPCQRLVKGSQFFHRKPGKFFDLLIWRIAAYMLQKNGDAIRLSRMNDIGNRSGQRKLSRPNRRFSTFQPNTARNAAS